MEEFVATVDQMVADLTAVAQSVLGGGLAITNLLFAGVLICAAIALGMYMAGRFFPDRFPFFKDFPQAWAFTAGLTLVIGGATWAIIATQASEVLASGSFGGW